MPSKLLKLLLWLIALCVALYLCICGYMFAQQRNMIFQGGLTQLPQEQTNFSLQRDVRCAAGSGIRQRARSAAWCSTLAAMPRTSSTTCRP